MRIVVTGAAGLVGSGVGALLRREHQVVGIDIRPGAEVDRIADIRDAAALAEPLAGAHAVVHVAALHAPHVGREAEAEFRRTNVEATDRLLSAARAEGVLTFVFTSSTSVYGRALEPQSGAAAWIDEAVEPQPRDIYDETKLAAEALVRAASGPRLRTAILRMSRCFPEPWREMALYRLHRGIDRRDVARAHALALGAARADTPIWIVSAPPPFVREDCGALLDDAPAVLRRRVPWLVEAFGRRSWPLPRSIGRVYSPARAEAELGFRAQLGADAVLAGDCDPRPLRT